MSPNKLSLLGKIIAITMFLSGVASLFLFAIGLTNNDTTNLLLIILFPVLSGGAFVFAALFAKFINGKATANYWARFPEIKTHAKLIGKTTFTDTQTVYQYRRGAHVSVQPKFNLTFELPDKQRLPFTVDENLFSTSFEKEEGILTYKETDGKRYFVSFLRS